jgi:hypothetical protein
MSKPTNAAQNVFNKLDGLLEYAASPPAAFHVYPQQAKAVINSRKRNMKPMDTPEYLDFSSYKNIPVIVLGGQI